jgi:hypothetical protein
MRSEIQGGYALADSPGCSRGRSPHGWRLGKRAAGRRLARRCPTTIWQRPRRWACGISGPRASSGRRWPRVEPAKTVQDGHASCGSGECRIPLLRCADRAVAAERAPRSVLITSQTKTSPNTYRWQQHAAWTRQLPARAVTNVSLPPSAGRTSAITRPN